MEAGNCPCIKLVKVLLKKLQNDLFKVIIRALDNCLLEKLVLGGDDVATDGQGIGFRCHNLCTHEADVANAISVVINVMMALRMVCH